MNIKKIKLVELRPYENNPRFNESAVEYVANSIREFGFQQPIVVDKDNVIIAGHTRYKASQALGLVEVPCVVADELTEEQVKAYRLADNKVGELAEWDFDLLNDELDDILTIDMSDFAFDMEVEEYEYEMEEDGEKGNLAERFGVPPFSILDTKQEYWQARKRAWKEITGNLSETRDTEYGRVGGSKSENIYTQINEGTSNFDPVLAEVMMKWFCRPEGRIVDPFGGEQTKGVVAGELGHHYVGMEIRPDQVELNKKRTAKYKNVTYACGDSNNIGQVLAGQTFNFCITSPPYYDLEVYSADDMSALGTYEEFMEQYANIFGQVYDLLEEDSFLVVKVAEIRDKKGVYRDFVPDNVKVMESVGFKYYNELILVNAMGTAPLRANRYMHSRKMVKVHQNVLVFYKGNVENIPNVFPVIEDEVEEYE